MSRMNLSLYCSVEDACEIAGVSKSYMYAMIDSGKIKAERFGRGYAVLKSSVTAFKRQPGMGRPITKGSRRTKAKSAKKRSR